ncbi:MAG: type VI secretion system amidase effector protein Tae4 [Bryobacteraceae bacterium]
MATVSAQTIWSSHPSGFPCDAKLFKNQCAIRMGVALNGAGISIATFSGAKCYPGLKHSTKHILRAQELADWLTGRTSAVGAVKIHKAPVSSVTFAGKKGLVFIKDGWGSTDHIDIWNGFALKGGTPDYFARGKEVWFWELP